MITTINMKKCGLYQCPQLSGQHLVKGHQKQMSKLEINKRMQFFFFSFGGDDRWDSRSRETPILLVALCVLPSFHL